MNASSDGMLGSGDVSASEKSLLVGVVGGDGRGFEGAGPQLMTLTALAEMCAMVRGSQCPIHERERVPNNTYRSFRARLERA